MSSRRRLPNPVSMSPLPSSSALKSFSNLFKPLCILQSFKHFSASLGGSRWMWHRLIDLAILIWRTLLTY
ncbi:hypothetical protein B0H11DRAFT_2184772 [Mycena galericulata]|nr:hypothetical protein B0H11DRAFT_2184772 [Mycena galericulata]